MMALEMVVQRVVLWSTPRCVLMYAQRAEGVSAGGAMRSAGEALLGANLIERGN